MKKTGTGRADGVWKWIIEDLFPEFVAFFLAKGSEDYDLSSVTFCDNELELILPDKDDHRVKRHSNKLIKVPLKSDKSKVDLIYVEVEASGKANFAKRMYVYQCLIFLKFQTPVRSFAIFLNPRKTIKNNFNFMTANSAVNFDFGYYAVMKQDPETLKMDDNPFALIILAARLQLQKAKIPEQELARQFEWIYRRLMSLKLPESKFRPVWVFINDAMRNCLENTKNYPLFAEKIKSITKTNKIMGLNEYVNAANARAEVLEKEKNALEKEKDAAIEEKKVADAKLKAAMEEKKAAMEEKKAAMEEKKAADAKLKAAFEDKISTIKVLLRDGLYSIERIAETYSVSEFFVKKIKKQLGLG